MQSQKFLLPVVMLLLLVSLSFSINPANYLYDNESADNLSEQRIFVDGQDYKLVYLDSELIFLLKDNEPITSQSEIDDVLTDYYFDVGYPTQEELDEISNLVEAYDESRFDNGSTIAGVGEEKLCLANLLMVNVHQGDLIDLFPCHDDESCELTELMWCSAIGEQPFSMCRPGEVIDDMKQISYASLGTDELIANFRARLSSSGEEALYDDLLYIRNNLAQLQQYAQDIESSVFKTPPSRAERKCYWKTMNLEINCFQVCGKLDIAHEDIIPQLEEKLDNVLDKLVNFAKHSEITTNLATESADRLNFRQNSDLKDDYLLKLKNVFNNAHNLEDEVADVLETKVLNQSLKNTYDDLLLVEEDLNQSLENLNFTNFESKLDLYDDLINETKVKLNATMSSYEDVLAAKGESELYIFVLGFEDLDASTKDTLDDLESQKETLDSKLDSVPTASELSDIQFSYSQVADDLGQIARNKEDPIVLSQLRGFARSVNSNVNLLLSSTAAPDYNQRQEYSQNLPVALSVLNFLALGSFGVFIFLFLISKMEFRRMRQIAIYGVFLAGFLFFVMLFSVGLYFYFDQTSNSSNFNEFVLASGNEQNASIVLNFEGSTQEVKDSMLACAQSLETLIEEKNKTASLYYVSNGCFEDGKKIPNVSSGECLAQTSGSIFYFDHSSSQKDPKITSIFVNELDLVGDKAYYDECNIANIFRVVSFDE